MYSVLFQPGNKEIIIDEDNESLYNLNQLLNNRKVQMGDIAYVVNQKQKYIVGHNYQWYKFNFIQEEV